MIEKIENEKTLTMGNWKHEKRGKNDDWKTDGKN